MSTSTSRPPDHSRRLRDGQRTPGLARVWDRMRAAMKRRNSAGAATDDDTARPERHPSPSTPGPSNAAERDVAIVADGPLIASSSSNTPCTSAESSMRPITPMPEKFGDLVPDDDPEGDSEAEMEEPALPMVFTSNRINHARAQEMFAKYGLKYEPRFTRTAHEPPSKIRRVQRPLHIRVRWTCHECSTGFGVDRTCVRCGHRRCDQCARHPPLTPANGITEGSGTDADRATTSQQTPDDTANMNEVTRSADDDGALRMTSLEEALGEPLEKDTGDGDGDEDDGDDGMTSESLYNMLQLSRTKQPRNRIDVVLKPKTQIIRRICHECQTQILPPNRTACQACGHHRCTLCPRYPPKPEKWPHGSPGDERPPPEDTDQMSIPPAVQRVYRKPRQRVRYVCEHCRTTFVQREHCEACGHGRCKDCIRIPPRRPVQATAEEVHAH